MNMLLLTNPNGGRKTTISKIIAATLFVVGVSLWFSIVDYVGFIAVFGTVEGYNLPLYAIENFSTASVNCYLWQYTILSAVFKAAGIWVISMGVLLVSLFGRNILLPFVISLGGTVCMIIVGEILCYYSNVWAKILNPYSMLCNRILFSKTEFVTFGNYPVLSYQAAFLWSVLIGLIITAVMVIGSSKNYHCRERRRNVRLSI